MFTTQESVCKNGWERVRGNDCGNVCWEGFFCKVDCEAFGMSIICRGGSNAVGQIGASSQDRCPFCFKCF